MECESCGQKAVISGPARCKQHFIEHFETRFWETIERFSLIRDDEMICVAASGGKDSLAVMHLLSKRYPIEALAVDEGIPGYRDRTLEDLRSFCEQRGIPLKVVDFNDLGAKSLAEQNPAHPCSVCGVLRRKALADHSSEYDIIATGHNLDDECQTILMNLLRNQRSLLSRMGPRTHGREGIASRIKPFCLTPEREIRAYCLLLGITANFAECPNVVKSFRWKVGEALNRLEQSRPGAKRNIMERFLSEVHEDTARSESCKRCGGPSASGLCRACQLVVNL